MPQPPHLPHRLLELLLPSAWAEQAVGDLTEEWRSWRSSHGPLVAGVRYGQWATGLLAWGLVQGLAHLPSAAAERLLGGTGNGTGRRSDRA